MRAFFMPGIVIAGFAAASADAAPAVVRYTFTGHITSLDDHVPFGMVLDVGSPVQGELAYDLASPGIPIASVETSYPQTLVAGIKVTTGGKSIETSNYLVYVDNTTSDSLIFANFQVPGKPALIDGAAGSAALLVGFLDPPGTLFHDTSLPPSIEFDRYASGVGEFDDPSLRDSTTFFRIDSLVPVPEPATLVLAAIGAFALLTRWG